MKIKYYCSLILISIAVASLFYTDLYAESISKDQARRAALKFMEKHESIRPGKNAVSSFLNNLIGSDKVNLSRTRTMRNENSNIIAYVHEMEPEGFIVTSADSKITPIIAFSDKGHFTYLDTQDNVLLDLIKFDVNKRLENANKSEQPEDNLVKKNMTEWYNYTMHISESSNETDYMLKIIHSFNSIFNIDSIEPLYAEDDDVQQWGPLITTDWYQSGYYNNKCPYVIPRLPGARRVVGCVATAMAQIINYWEYPSSLFFDARPYPSGDSYNFGIDIDSDADTYGFLIVDPENWTTDIVCCR